MLRTHLTKTVMFALAALAVMMPELASAQVFQAPLCAALTLITGDAGIAIASLAVVTLGIGALLARVSWGMVVMICIGIIVIFSAPAIMGVLGFGGCA